MNPDYKKHGGQIKVFIFCKIGYFFLEIFVFYFTQFHYHQMHQIFNEKVEFEADPKVDHLNPDYKKPGGHKKVFVIFRKFFTHFL